MYLTKRYLSTCSPPEVYHKNRLFQHGSEVPGPSLSSNPRRRAWLVDGIEFLEDQIVLAQELHILKMVRKFDLQTIHVAGTLAGVFSQGGARK